MKKITLAMMSILASIFAFGACEMLSVSGLSSGVETVSHEEVSKEASFISTSNEEVSGEESTSSEETSVEDGGDEAYWYNAFTPAEKTLFETYVGLVIPFMPNNEYYIKGYHSETDYENGLCFYTIGNTVEEFTDYREAYKDYNFIGTSQAEDGYLWYYYEKDDVLVTTCHYEKDGETYSVMYARFRGVIDDGTDSPADSAGGETPEGGDEGGTTGHTYNDFTPEQKTLFETYVGAVIPFLPNSEYYVEGYNTETDYENGMCFYTIGNNANEFALYRASYTYFGYEWTDTYEDDLGDTWYTYEKDALVVDMCYYYDEGEYWLVVYVLSLDISDTPDDGEVDDNETPDNGGNETPKEEDGTGTRVVDFTKATNVKNVTDQGYYVDGCPTTGQVKVLVIPVEFSDATAANKGYTTAKLDTIFNGGAGTTDYYSVKDYYEISSYGALHLDFVVLENWFKPSNRSSYYKRATMDYYGQSMEIGDQMIMDEALAYLESRMDLTEFDSDNNGIIDAVVMINTLDINSDVNFNWAYRYWNIYTDNSGYYYEYDKVSANDYMWASYKFLMESYDDYGNPSYSHSTMNPYTYIHEFGHILGADDYYDTAYKNEPMGGYDMMDSMLGDHNAFTKFNYGWLTTARLITAEESVTLFLDSFTKTGDAVIIANNWDDKLGAYQEYFIVVYYTNTGLNSGEGGYFAENGILVYHVNAALDSETNGGETYYDLKYNNTDKSDEYGTEHNLIELVESADGNYLFGEYDGLGANVTTDNGQKVAYVFTVNEITEDNATITFRKNN